MAFGSVNQTTGERTQLAGLFDTNSISSISVNGVAQTVSSGAVDLDVASNLIPEAQWTTLAGIFS